MIAKTTFKLFVEWVSATHPVKGFNALRLRLTHPTVNQGYLLT